MILPLGLQSLLGPGHNVDLSQDPDQLEPILAQLFAFAYIWGLGGNLAAPCQQPFTAFVRGQLGGLLQLPQNWSAFDFLVTVKKTPQGMVAEMQQWGSVVLASTYNRKTPFSQMLVPTVDTVRYSFLLQVSNHLPDLLSACATLVVAQLLLSSACATFVIGWLSAV